MTRDEKLEAMARAWCRFNGWQPDHRPDSWQQADLLEPLSLTIVKCGGEPIWKAHIKAMEALLTAIGE